MRRGLVTLGEALGTVSLSEPGTLAAGSPARLSFAGAEATVAIGVARQGHPVRWIGAVGDDDLGRMIVERLRAEGIDLAGVRSGGGPTALLLKHRRTAGITRVAYYRRGTAGATLDVGDIRLDAEDAVLHVTGITPALGPGPARAVAHAVDRARALGVTVSLDVNHRSALWTSEEAAPVLAPLARRADVVFGDAGELELVGGPSALRDDGVGEVVLKDGANGARSWSGAGELAVPALPAVVVDPVGAGDAFVAGYLGALLDGLGEADRLERGVRFGAVAVATIGDWEGLPTLAELELLTTGADVLR